MSEIKQGNDQIEKIQNNLKHDEENANPQSTPAEDYKEEAAEIVDKYKSNEDPA